MSAMDKLKSSQILTLIVLLIAGAGCGTLPTPARSSAVPPTTDAETEDASVGLTTTFGPGDFNLLDPALGLDQLSNYRASLTISFDGTRGGQASVWARSYEMLSIQAPPARQLTVQISGTDGGPGAGDRQLFDVGGLRYEQTETGCTAAIAADTDRWQQPATMLPLVIGAEQEETSTVNGIDATRYRFDERALGEQGQADSTGEMWIDEQGRLVKFVLRTKGDSSYFGEGLEGTLKLDYMITPGELAATVEIPAECPAGLIDAPVMPDAESVQQLPGVTQFATASDLAAVTAFYQQQLTETGWQPSGEPTITDTLAAALFTRGNQQLSVFATRSEQQTIVRLVLINLSAP